MFCHWLLPRLMTQVWALNQLFRIQTFSDEELHQRHHDVAPALLWRCTRSGKVLRDTIEHLWNGFDDSWRAATKMILPSSSSSSSFVLKPAKPRSILEWKVKLCRSYFWSSNIGFLLKQEWKIILYLLKYLVLSFSRSEFVLLSGHKEEI